MPFRFKLQSNIFLPVMSALVALAACQSAADVNAQDPAQKAAQKAAQKTALQNIAQSVQVRADVWVDNYFELSVNGSKVLVDSTPFNTERSFNGDSGTFDITLPATIALEFRDFYENDTGLEYIGSARQQMGDGGGVAQIKEISTGRTLFVTDESLRCTVIHHAPIDKSCQNERNPQVGEGACAGIITQAPEGWRQPGFDDSHWSAPTIFNPAAVRPRQDYHRVNWDAGVKFIWGPDLEQDNIVLCRARIEG